MSSRVFLTSCLIAGALTACHKQPPADEHMSHMASGDLSQQPVASSTSQGDLSLPASSMHTAARLAASPRHSEWVKLAYPDGKGDSLMAWIVYPSTSNAKTPVVVVIHEIYGLSSWIRGVADQLASQGFIAIAPDLNSRIRGEASADSIRADSAVKLANKVPPADRNAAIDAAATYAMSQPSAAARYAIIGFCYGGSTTWIHTINGGVPGFSGGVAYYGLPYMNGAVPNADSLKKITKPIMLLSGAKDARITAGMPAVDSTMKALGKWYYGNNYQGAVHGFARQQDDPKANRDEAEEQANLAAVKDAWPRTIAFLKKNLGVQ
ncbi:MAG TPA: dienelactone hydrolase family protein [Gemmatimonadaceae bacterium]|nr:dienelactone hydrolase family protein [Gemmatimonadaceae bacterium]